MTEQEARTLLMDYLYEEISRGDKQKLEAYMEDHPELRRELDRLRDTRALLGKMPEAESGRRLTVVEGRRRSPSEWLRDAKELLPRTALGRAGMTIAAGLVLLLFVASVARTHITWTDNGVIFSMGSAPVVNEGISPNDAQELVRQIREENAAMMEQFAVSINEQNRQQLQQVVRYFEQQRRNDLQLTGEALTQLQENTTEQWLSYNRYLGNLLQNVNFQDQNE